MQSSSGWRTTTFSLAEWPSVFLLFRWVDRITNFKSMILQLIPLCCMMCTGWCWRAWNVLSPFLSVIEFLSQRNLITSLHVILFQLIPLCCMMSQNSGWRYGVALSACGILTNLQCTCIVTHSGECQLQDNRYASNRLGGLGRLQNEHRTSCWLFLFGLNDRYSELIMARFRMTSFFHSWFARCVSQFISIDTTCNLIPALP